MSGDGKVDRLEAKIDLLIEMVRGVDGRLRAVETGLAELRGNVDGRMTEMSHRITDIYTRLPVPIAYQPSGKQRA
ncbi:MAG: hypothetical protein HQL33_10795 [Alphaproteobacteria bacterium]|nr:hypothetical protein [Alphaproteobacteria bacterium]MBF0130468.1 hypothetical protein [Alphaproteobacteria bacterium]